MAIRRHGAAQQANDLFPEALAFGCRAVVQECDPARQVVEHQHRWGRAERRLRNAFLWPGEARQAFEQPHDVVAGNSNETAGERQVLDLWLR